MRRVLTTVAMLGFTALTAPGCGLVSNMYAGGPSPAGLIYTQVKAPAQGLSVATEAMPRASKSGTSSAAAVLSLFAFGNAGIDAAMEDGGITKVHHVDHEVMMVCGGFFFLRTKTIVHGE